MRDLDFISGRFAETPIPKEQRFLLKYFKTPLQRAILKYYLVFGDTSCFIDHTGFHTTKSYLYRQEQKLNELLAAHKQAKDAFDFDALWEIESGKYRHTSDKEDHGRSPDNSL